MTVKNPCEDSVVLSSRTQSRKPRKPQKEMNSKRRSVMRAAERAGFWKLLSRVVTDNIASRALIRSLGFREVGIYEKHGYLDGVWRDVVIVEHLIPANLHGEL